MKLIYEINEKPIKGDMLIFNGKGWVLIKKSQVLYETETELTKIKEEIEVLKNVLVKVDGKLESHHKILQKLTQKEGE